MTSALTDMIEIPEKGRQNGAEEKKKKRIKKKKKKNGQKKYLKREPLRISQINERKPTTDPGMSENPKQDKEKHT